MDSPNSYAKAFPCNDKDHSYKDHGCLSLCDCSKFNEPVGTAAERQDTQPQLSWQGSWLRCGSWRAVALPCHATADRPKLLRVKQLNAACTFRWALQQCFMTSSCSLVPQRRHQASSELINSTKRSISFLAQMEHNINGIKPPRPKLHHASCTELLEALAQISIGTGISAVLPRARWSNAPAPTRGLHTIKWSSLSALRRF